MLKVIPSECMRITVPSNGSSVEGKVTLSNQQPGPVLFKILSNISSKAPARILGLCPNSGFLMPNQCQIIKVVAVAFVRRGELVADDWSDESLKGKLVIQTKSVQGGSNDEDFNPEQGDHRKSMWDISDDSFVDSDIVEQELEVHLKLLHPGQQSPSSPVLSLTRVASSMRQSTPTCPGSNESSSSVIDSIQELMTKNEELKRTVDELEAMPHMDLDMLEQARQEIEEAKMKSLITSNLLKQVDIR